jgi:hypothetical protein
MLLPKHGNLPGHHSKNFVTVLKIMDFFFSIERKNSMPAAMGEG